MDGSQDLLSSIINEWIIIASAWLDALKDYAEATPENKENCKPEDIEFPYPQDLIQFERYTNSIYRDLASVHYNIASDVRQAYHDIINSKYDLERERQTIKTAISGLRSYQHTELSQDTKDTGAGGIDDKPDDLRTLTVIVKKYKVAKITLRRMIKKGQLESFRESNKPNAPHLVSEKEIAKRLPEK